MSEPAVKGYRNARPAPGGAFKGAPREIREEARDFLAGRIMAPGMQDADIMQRVEDELNGMTLRERVFMEIDMRERVSEYFTADYDAGPWGKT